MLREGAHYAAKRGRLIRRKRDEGFVLPPPEQLRNSGHRRTPEKRALLARLRQVPDENGVESFPANY